MSRLRIGTRGSALARAQAEHVKLLLCQRHPGLEVEIVVIRVSGDRRRDGAQHAPDTPADKRRWVDVIEQALSGGEIDVAVHSAKDVPGELGAGLSLLGAPARLGAEDALCGELGRAGRGSGPDARPVDLDTLPRGATVGTSSIRRSAQLRAARPDLSLLALSGNVDTRLERLTAGSLDAIVLARAGLQRLGSEGKITAILDPVRFVPAPGQGALALEARSGDARAAETLAAILDADTSACLLAERALARALGASCHTPLGAHATPAGCGCLHLRAWVGLPDGSAWIADELLGGF